MIEPLPASRGVNHLPSIGDPPRTTPTEGTAPMTISESRAPAMPAATDFLDTLARRNAEFAGHDFSAGLKMLPSRRTMIIGCVDPRVDPMDILKLEPGEAAVIRNIGGRVNPAVFEMMAILGTVSRLAGQAAGPG